MKRALILFLSCIVLVACDSGDILPKNETVSGREVCATFTLEELDAFPESEYYQLVFGAFENAGQYPLSFRTISKPAEGAVIDPVLSNIPDKADMVALSLLDKGKKLICHLYTHPITGMEKESITLPGQTVRLANYGRVQSQVFSIKCIACHGGADITARGLNLTSGHSHAALVDKNSRKFPVKLLVKPGSNAGSFLIEALTSLNTLAPDHTEIVKQDDINLLRTWIAGGSNE